MKNIRKTLLATLAGAGISVGAHAGALVDITCNVDMYNLTGQTANDFHIQVGSQGGSIHASDVQQVFMDPTRAENPFPNLSVTDQTYGVLVDYSGADVANGQAVHVGIKIPSMSGAPYVIDQYWTKDGVKIGSPAYRCALSPADFRDGTITNSGADTAWVQRRVLYETSNVALDDLLVGKPAWNSATLIDNDLVAMAGGSSLGYTFAAGGDGAYLMAYDVYVEDAASGKKVLSETVLQAFNVVPEPATLVLFGSAALLALRRRRQPTA